MKRREFLSNLGSTATAFGAYTIVSGAFLNQFFIENALGSEVSLNELAKILGPEEATVLVPSSPDFAKFNKAFNMRVQVTPAVRVLCLTEESIAKCIQWSRTNNIPLAMRNGGHSYEGFSSTTGLVIDVRLREKMNLYREGEDTFLQVESGAKLGKIYEFLAPHGLAIPAGSCPTVGVTGHTTGGGFGLLARTFGLACDSLLKARIVMANGEILNASESENPDLFWAIRGAGGGSFGVVTELTFKTSKVKEVVVFGATYSGDQKTILAIMKQWLAWAPASFKEINCLMRLQRVSDKSWSIRIYGQRVPLENETVEQTQKRVNDMLEKFNRIKAADAGKFVVKPLSFIDSVHRFAGSETELSSVYMKGKSDYIKNGISDDGLLMMMSQIPTGVASMFDCYGGVIADRKDSDTAFAHRENTLCSIQHYSEWRNSSDSQTKVATLQKYYDSLRPYMSGSSYFNYCDLDIKNYAEAYWGSNLAKLVQIKKKFDPQNIFKHAQSVPLVVQSINQQNANQQNVVQNQVSVVASSAIIPLSLVSGPGGETSSPIESKVQLITVNGVSMIYAKFEVNAPKIFAPPTLASGQYPYQFEAVELFLRTNQDSQEKFSYYEIELSPFNQTFTVRVDCANSKKAFVNDVDLGLKTKVTRKELGWTGEMWIPTVKLSWKGKSEDITGNLYAILGQKPNRSFYSSFTPPQVKPNFHLPELFKRLF